MLGSTFFSPTIFLTLGFTGTITKSLITYMILIFSLSKIYVWILQLVMSHPFSFFFLLSASFTLTSCFPLPLPILTIICS